jgi:monofunctional biosynthetic peptidoglycan transglycosylase
MKTVWRHIGRLLALLLLAALSLQLYFLLRIALMLVIDPQSTSFQRSEAWRLLSENHSIAWSQQWADDAELSRHIKRAVIASEDASFTDHSGIDWDAVEKAWERNQREEARTDKLKSRLRADARPKAAPVAKIRGGSTITQQLAKNLFLGSERSLARKGQEFVITLMLEALLSKQRILDIYLNSVEWGEGIFGAQAAARHYFRVDAKQLTPSQAARLAVMLPAPKRFEKRPASSYVLGRAGTIEARMGAVELP